MSRRKAISQAEARRLLKQVATMERDDRERRRRWVASYPGGTHIATLSFSDLEMIGRLKATTMLGFALVGKLIDNDKLYIFALPTDEGGRP